MVRILITTMLSLLLLAGCTTPSKKETTRSMYYWSTTFHITPRQQHFLQSHHITRLYVRYFDVVTGKEGIPMPNATISFVSPRPKGIEIIPTIFITNDCMKQSINDLPEKILKRIVQMNDTHDIGNVHEIQIDCDWTLSTRTRYFDFLNKLHQLAQAKGIRLSTTVRLHQLSQPIPPADHGVLMVYNTGDFTKLEEHKPILNADSVASYVRHCGSYQLPLSAAYPIYSWRILFRNGRYIGIMHADDDLPVIPGDSIALRQPTFDEIESAKAMIGKWNTTANQEVILFDLSDKNIKNYKANDYEKIFAN